MKRIEKVYVTLFALVAIIGTISTMLAFKCDNKRVPETCLSQEETIEPFVENPTSISDRCRKAIKEFEGCSLTPINDCGYWAVGYGHQVCKVSEPKPASITMEEAERLFEEDVNKWTSRALKFAEDNGFSMNQGQLDALVDFLFQFGYRTEYMEKKRFFGQDFKNFILGNIDEDELKEEIVEYCHYTNDNGKRVKSARILQRRLVEFSWITE